MLRVGGYHTPYPPSRLEEEYLPDLDRVLDAVDRVAGVLRSRRHERREDLPAPRRRRGPHRGRDPAWHVKPGDTVVVNQTIVEIETAKAAVELPCPYAGVVAEVFVAEGDVVAVGVADPVDHDRGAAPASAPGRGTGAPVPAPASAGRRLAPAGASPQREAVLVGYGVQADGHAAAPRARARARPARHDRARGRPARRGREAGAPRRARGGPARRGGAVPPQPRARQAAGAQARQGPRRRPRGGRRHRRRRRHHARGRRARGDARAAARAGRRARLAGSPPGPASGRRPARAGERETRTPVKGVTKLDGRGDGGERVHRAARHRVGRGRRHAHARARRPAARRGPSSRACR